MADNWRRASLSEEVNILTGFPFQSRLYTEDEDGIPLVRGDNVVQGKFRWEDVKRWPATNTDQFSAYFLQAGDVVVAMDRPWIEAGLKYACVSQHDLPCLLVQRVARLRAKSGLDQRFLRYVVANPGFTNHVLSVQTGTAVPHISAHQIREYRFLCPPISEQRAIGAILGALDDKIDLNRRMNETLEAMARALFKSWFVDFDPVRVRMEGREPVGMDAETAALFPDSFEEYTLGEAPSGWYVRPAHELLTVSRTGLNPSEFPEETFEHFSIPAYDEGRRPKAEKGDQIKSGKFLVPTEAVLLSKLNPRIPRIWLPRTSGERRRVCSTEFIVTVPRGSSTREFVYSMFSEPSFLGRFASMVTGTTGSHQRVRPEHLLTMEVLVPPKPAIVRFTELVRPLLQRLAVNTADSVALTAIRDALLPKLLSGEMRVQDAEAEARHTMSLVERMR